MDPSRWRDDRVAGWGSAGFDAGAFQLCQEPAKLLIATALGMVAGNRDGGVTQNAAVKPGQYLRRSDFAEHAGSALRQPTDQLDIVDRRRELRHKVGANLGRIADQPAS